MGSSLSIRQGIDGEDGFSPTIDVFEETDKTYILNITDYRGSYLTPNLMPDIGQIGPLKHKVDTDLGNLSYHESQPNGRGTIK